MVVRFNPSTLHVSGVDDVKVGARRLLAVAVSAYGVELMAFVPGFAKVNVCVPDAIVMSKVPLALPKLFEPVILTVKVPA